MPAPRKKVVRKKVALNPGPTDEPGQQPTPDSDSLVELEGAAAILGGVIDIAKAGAAFASVATDAGRSVTDRYFQQSFKDTDIGMDEVLRASLASRYQSLTALGMCFDHAKGMAALNGQHVDHARNSDDSFYSGLAKSTSTHAAGLLDAYGLETDNEVLSTVALTKLVQGLANRISGIEEALLAASK